MDEAEVVKPSVSFAETEAPKRRASPPSQPAKRQKSAAYVRLAILTTALHSRETISLLHRTARTIRLYWYECGIAETPLLEAIQLPVPLYSLAEHALGTRRDLAPA